MNKIVVASLILIVVALIAAGCGPAAEPTAVPVTEPTAAPVTEPTAVPVSDATGEIGGSNPAAARDRALAHLAAANADQAPPAGLEWAEKDTTAQGLMGGSSMQYTSGDWRIDVSYPIVAPDATIYRLIIDNPATGFHWEGRVNAHGLVAEGPEAVQTARDAALASIAVSQAVELPPPDMPWTGGRATPEGLVGSETYEYTAGDWKVTITYPVTAPEQVVYDIKVENKATGFTWQGQMDAQGTMIGGTRQ